MAERKVASSLFALLVVTLLCACSPVSASPEWVTMDDGAKYMCQVDMSTVRFFGGETDKTLDVWIKAIKKEQPDSYSITHMFIKEDLIYMEKEYGKYSSADDSTISSTDSGEKGWGPLPADSPGGRIAKKLFAGYRANVKAADPPQVTVDPQELQKALDEKKINQGVNEEYKTKWFYVRNTCVKRLSNLAFDFWLLVDKDNKRTHRLNYSIIARDLSNFLPRGGWHEHNVEEAIFIRVDGQDWYLKPPVPKGATSFPYHHTKHKFSFEMPPALVQALVTTKNGVYLRWRYDNEDSEYTIPVEQVRNIGLMYAGCK